MRVYAPLTTLVATPAVVLQPRWRAVVGVAARPGWVVGCLLLVLQFVWPGSGADRAVRGGDQLAAGRGPA